MYDNQDVQHTDSHPFTCSLMYSSVSACIPSCSTNMLTILPPTPALLTAPKIALRQVDTKAWSWGRVCQVGGGAGWWWQRSGWRREGSMPRLY